MTPIKVLLVDDSPVAMSIFRQVLDSAPEVQVVGTAQDGAEALNLIPRVQPQVICTDLKMPKMDGLEFIKQVMAKTPLPILVLSDAVQKQDIENVFQVLQAGAVDVMPKPISISAADREELKRQLITKIRVLASKQVSAKPFT
ncbi:MAG: Protein-glutamate methylesterase/protein-glutamine glutaminase [Chroococcidiopsis sp. SAG 2025]|uniref:response regulator n=1 Tax=Chroococcidiopsis sp. SAG 2025 TaxID=171389 RepID=UPI00293711EC|nr:response regulator [Chroococcidiopsis sp. SAG 2025]MDV2990367.1 Protein-glutamate methylesterase/protein-glutamine glutaminase [Chroococcidiopsis sp. SAG 2025]